MSKVLKTVALSLAALLMTGTLGSCSKNTEGDEGQSSSYADTITFANHVKDTMEVAYVDAVKRDRLSVKNMDMTIVENIAGAGHQTAELKRTGQAAPYLANTLDLVVETTDGRMYRSASSSYRMNMWRHGLYFDEVQILGDKLKRADVDPLTAPVRASFDFQQGTDGWQANTLMSTPTSTDQGALTTTISDPKDPYFANTKVEINADQGNVLLLRVKANALTGGDIFFATAQSPGFSATKRVPYKAVDIAPGGEYATYMVDMSDNAEWKGTVTGLRVDFNGTTSGETVALDDIKLVDLKGLYLNARLQKTYNLYPDKVYQTYKLLIGQNVAIKSVYLETLVPTDRAERTVIADATGTHSDETFDHASVGYVGFSSGKWGTFGVIYPSIKQPGTVAVEKTDDGYRLRQYADIGNGAFSTGQSIEFGSRLYMGGPSAGFDGLAAAAAAERHPLTADNITVENADANTGFVQYEPLKGYYTFQSPGAGDLMAVHETNKNLYRQVDIRIKNDAYDRNVYIQHRDTGMSRLQSALLLDDRGYPLPIPVQGSKNFKGENEEPVFNPDDKLFNESYFPIALKSGQEQQVTSIHAYENWGNHPLKQISSISFVVPYYHLSTGIVETTCWSPFFFGGRTGWILTDFRDRSGTSWQNGLAYDSVGANYLFQYTTDGVQHQLNYQGSKLDSVGPNYSDMTMHFLTDDRKADVSFRTVEFPQTDENRVFAQMDIRFNDDLTIKNAAENLGFFSSRSFHENQIFHQSAYLDEHNQSVAKTIDYTNPQTELHPLGSENPFWAMYNFTFFNRQPPQGGGTNVGVLITSSKFKIGGKATNEGLAFGIKKESNQNSNAYLTLNTGDITFKKGDSIKLNLILMPYGTSKSTYDKVTQLREQYGQNPLTVDVKQGHKVPDVMVPTIKTADGKAEFTVKGGYNNVAVKAEGFQDYTLPAIYEWKQGAWQPFNPSVVGHDGVEVYRDDQGKTGFAFVFNTDGSPHTFRVEDRSFKAAP